jgi:hypothetical protein
MHIMMEHFTCPERDCRVHCALSRVFMEHARFGVLGRTYLDTAKRVRSFLQKAWKISSCNIEQKTYSGFLKCHLDLK